MAGFVKRFLRLSLISMALPVIAFAAQAPNQRSSSVARTATNVRSSDNVSSDKNLTTRRAAATVISRSVSRNRQSKPEVVVSACPASLTARSTTVRSNRNATTMPGKSRSATKSGIMRTATTKGNPGNNTTVSRAAKSRATAIFSDVTKIGTGYSNCRDAYATCMDQFCAVANDTYRRCYCSDRFASFRETEEKLDSALQMLAEFQNNNLEAIDKTAAEVNAMYTATEGEDAIKKDTSASQQLLSNIEDVLSGKKTTTATTKNNSLSLGILDLDFNSDDIWGGSSSLFDVQSNTDITSLEGKKLYNTAADQCADVVRESCGGDAMFKLASSSYSIMVTQDCNLYEKNINAKKASIEETVRTAEKYLRDARLEEYRAHNSGDANECLTKVEEAITQPLVCGTNYEKCMDYTGLYINSNTGQPVYSQALFKLNSLIVLDGSADVLGANPNFDNFLEDKKTFAESALDTCRSNADFVWSEFKRMALIKIAQAQDDKIQSVKDSCVATIKECYDTQTGALQDLDTTSTRATQAIAAATARGMCYQDVMACAALYGDVNGCKYDDATKKLTVNPDCKPDNDTGVGCVCGLQSLLTYVDTVDAVKVAEGCESVLSKYAHELCDPKVGSDKDVVYPMGCAATSRSELRAAMDARIKMFCATDLVKNDQSNTINTSTDVYNTELLNRMVKDIYDELGLAFTAGCEDEGGVWVDSGVMATPVAGALLPDFYKKYYNVSVLDADKVANLHVEDVGWCLKGNEKDQCEALGSQYAVFTVDKGCELTEAWYNSRCSDLGGNWSGEQCSITNFSIVLSEQ